MLKPRSQGPDRADGGLDEVAQLRSGKGRVAEVVVGGDEAPPALRGRLGRDHHQLDRTENVERSRECQRRLGGRLGVSGDSAVAVAVPRWWQDDKAVALHAQ